jgi:hypothetical protein
VPAPTETDLLSITDVTVAASGTTVSWTRGLGAEIAPGHRLSNADGVGQLGGRRPARDTRMALTAER